MKYAVLACINGSYTVHAEGFTSLDKAVVNYHSYCAALWNDTNPVSATVMICDEQLDAVNGYKERIVHD